MAARTTKVTIPRPRAFAKTVSLFGQPTPTGSAPSPKQYAKSKLQNDPGKFGNFGFNILGVNPMSTRGSK